MTSKQIIKGQKYFGKDYDPDYYKKKVKSMWVLWNNFSEQEPELGQGGQENISGPGTPRQDQEQNRTRSDEGPGLHCRVQAFLPVDQHKEQQTYPQDRPRRENIFDITKVRDH